MRCGVPHFAGIGMGLMASRPALDRPVNSIVTLVPLRHVKEEHRGTPLRSVSSFAFGILDLPGVAWITGAPTGDLERR